MEVDNNESYNEYELVSKLNKKELHDWRVQWITKHDPISQPIQPFAPSSALKKYGKEVQQETPTTNGSSINDALQSGLNSTKHILKSNLLGLPGAIYDYAANNLTPNPPREELLALPEIPFQRPGTQLEPANVVPQEGNVIPNVVGQRENGLQIYNVNPGTAVNNGIFDSILSSFMGYGGGDLAGYGSNILTYLPNAYTPNNNIHQLADTSNLADTSDYEVQNALDNKINSEYYNLHLNQMLEAHDQVKKYMALPPPARESYSQSKDWKNFIDRYGNQKYIFKNPYEAYEFFKNKYESLREPTIIDNTDKKIEEINAQIDDLVLTNDGQSIPVNDVKESQIIEHVTPEIDKDDKQETSLTPISTVENNVNGVETTTVTGTKDTSGIGEKENIPNNELIENAPIPVSNKEEKITDASSSNDLEKQENIPVTEAQNELAVDLTMDVEKEETKNKVKEDLFLEEEEEKERKNSMNIEPNPTITPIPGTGIDNVQALTQVISNSYKQFVEDPLLFKDSYLEYLHNIQKTALINSNFSFQEKKYIHNMIRHITNSVNSITKDEKNRIPQIIKNKMPWVHSLKSVDLKTLKDTAYNYRYPLLATRGPLYPAIMYGLENDAVNKLAKYFGNSKETAAYFLKLIDRQHMHPGHRFLYNALVEPQRLYDTMKIMMTPANIASVLKETKDIALKEIPMGIERYKTHLQEVNKLDNHSAQVFANVVEDVLNPSTWASILAAGHVAEAKINKLCNYISKATGVEDRIKLLGPALTKMWQRWLPFIMASFGTTIVLGGEYRRRRLLASVAEQTARAVIYDQLHQALELLVNPQINHDLVSAAFNYRPGTVSTLTTEPEMPAPEIPIRNYNDIPITHYRGEPRPDVAEMWDKLQREYPPEHVRDPSIDYTIPPIQNSNPDALLEPSWRNNPNWRKPEKPETVDSKWLNRKNPDWPLRDSHKYEIPRAQRQWYHEQSMLHRNRYRHHKVMLPDATYSGTTLLEGQDPDTRGFNEFYDPKTIQELEQELAKIEEQVFDPTPLEQYKQRYEHETRDLRQRLEERMNTVREEMELAQRPKQPFLNLKGSIKFIKKSAGILALIAAGAGIVYLANNAFNSDPELKDAQEKLIVYQKKKDGPSLTTWYNEMKQFIKDEPKDLVPEKSAELENIQETNLPFWKKSLEEKIKILEDTHIYSNPNGWFRTPLKPGFLPPELRRNELGHYSLEPDFDFAEKLFIDNDKELEQKYIQELKNYKGNTWDNTKNKDYPIHINYRYYSDVITTEEDKLGLLKFLEKYQNDEEFTKLHGDATNIYVSALNTKKMLDNLEPIPESYYKRYENRRLFKNKPSFERILNFFENAYAPKSGGGKQKYDKMKRYADENQINLIHHDKHSKLFTDKPKIVKIKNPKTISDYVLATMDNVPKTKEYPTKFVDEAKCTGCGVSNELHAYEKDPIDYLCGACLNEGKRSGKGQSKRTIPFYPIDKSNHPEHVKEMDKRMNNALLKSIKNKELTNSLEERFHESAKPHFKDNFKFLDRLGCGHAILHNDNSKKDMKRMVYMIGVHEHNPYKLNNHAKANLNSLMINHLNKYHQPHLKEEYINPKHMTDYTSLYNHINENPNVLKKLII